MSWLLVLIFYACNAGCALEKTEYAVATEALCHARGAAFAPWRVDAEHPENSYSNWGPRAVYWCVANN